MAYSKEYKESYYDFIRNLNNDPSNKHRNDSFQKDFLLRHHDHRLAKRALLDEKQPQFSKLRNVLTDAVSNVTRTNSLRKGESVELTLEIEVVGVEDWMTRSPVVDVRIIQHENPKDFTSRSNVNSIKITTDYENTSPTKNTVSLVNTDNLSYRGFEACANKESPLSWFRLTNDRVGNTVIKSTSSKSDSKLGYENVEENKTVTKARKTKLTPTSKESLLVKKRSDLLFPTKTPERTEPNKSTRLQSDVANLSHESKHINAIKNKEQNTIPLYSIGTDSNPLQLTGSFDIPSKLLFGVPCREQLEEQHILEISKSLSRSECCLSKGADTARVKRSKSLIDFRVMRENDIAVRCRDPLGDYIPTDARVTITTSRRRRHGKRLKIRPSSHDSVINDGKRVLAEGNSKDGESKPIGYCENTSSKDVNRRIEMVVLNELQNLALKDGMECRVIHLPTTEAAPGNITSVSSFTCKLDISDTNIRSTLKRFCTVKSKHDEKATSLLKNRSKAKEPPTERQTEKGIGTLTSKNTYEYTEMATQLGKMADQLLNAPQYGHTTDRRIKQSKIPHKEKITPSLNCESDERDTKVIYFNSKVHSWSSESHFSKRSPASGLTQRHPFTTTMETEYDPSQTFRESNFVKKIKSDDSTWKTFMTKTSSTVKGGERVSVCSYVRKKSNKTVECVEECETRTAVEFDIEFLEEIIRVAKEEYNASKICLSIPRKMYDSKSLRLTGKRSKGTETGLLAEINS